MVLEKAEGRATVLKTKTINNDITIVIVTRDRLDALYRTLEHLYRSFVVPVLVYIDGRDGDVYASLRGNYTFVTWVCGERRIGASRARNTAFGRVDSKYIVNLDDDASILTVDALRKTSMYFSRNDRCGIIAFSILWSTADEVSSAADDTVSHLTKEFVGCGWAVRKCCHDEIGGFPVWMNQYGEELYYSLSAYQMDWEVHALTEVKVQHRVDRKARKAEQSYRSYWMYHQMYNSVGVIVTKYPGKRIVPSLMRLFVHNWLTYAFKTGYSASYYRSLWAALGSLKAMLEGRRPLTDKQFEFWLNLPEMPYYTYEIE